MEIDFISSLHNSTKRNYLSRVNNKKYPKYKAAILAKKWGYHYWDGSRHINYGGYKYIENRWLKVIKKICKHYNLKKIQHKLKGSCTGFVLTLKLNYFHYLQCLYLKKRVLRIFFHTIL